MVRPPSKGRQRIDIAFIKDKDSRQVTFSKRRSGLFMKGSEIFLLCGARVALIAFSEAGNAFGMGTPSTDHVIRRHALLPGDDDEGAPEELDDREAVEAVVRWTEEVRALVAAEQARMDAIGRKVLQAAAGKQFWWEADVQVLGEAELPELTRVLQRLRVNVQRKADKCLQGQ